MKATFTRAVAPALTGLALLAAATPATAAAGAEEIAQAFEQKGMAAEQSQCYGRTIAEKLEPARHAEAAEIVSTASNGEEIEEDVKAGGLEMVEAFLAANTACGT